MTDNTRRRRPTAEIDAHVGRRVRARRREIGMSMEALAFDLQLTYQQIQKYERGDNRISASTLYRIAGCLKAPVSYFFGGLPQLAVVGDLHHRQTARLDALLATQGGGDLLDAFVTLPPKLRRPIVDLVCGMAGGAPEA